ncbi:DUF982 domain-containing protein [Mesorhizobium sp. M0520]|uniref:DUF982 domain-containing protein n=1 Tax=Mesorhizobium sp. M0520 TaxID=2956957 RepID=UPI003335926E
MQRTSCKKLPPCGFIDFFNEWPEHRRDRTYEAALTACFDACNGRKPASAARTV